MMHLPVASVGVIIAVCLLPQGPVITEGMNDIPSQARSNLLQELKAEIDRLSRRVAELEGDRSAWLTNQRIAEVQQLVHDVLADADTRASLLGSSMTAGYDEGFTIGSADGNFLLRINGQLQTRWVCNHQRGGGIDPRPAFDIDTFKEWALAPMEDGGLGFPDPEGFVTIEDVLVALIPGIDVTDIDAMAEFLEVEDEPFAVPFILAAELDGLTDEEIAPILELIIDEFRNQLSAMARRADRHRSGFEAARTKLLFSGHAVNPQWQYLIEGSFSRSGGTFRLLDAYIAYDFGNGFRAQIGQFKAPLLREELVDSRYQQAVERSLVNSFFTAGRSQGIMLSYEIDRFLLQGAYHDGSRGLNSPVCAILPSIHSTTSAF